MEIQKAILDKVSETNSHGMVVDVSKTELIDSYMARLLLDTARMLSLMGVKTILVGLRPAVALGMVEMGLNIRGVNCELNVDSALQILDTSNSAERYY